MAAGAGLPSLSSWTSAPATAASCGSTTLILISAEAKDVRIDTRPTTNRNSMAKKMILANTREQRMHVSFITVGDGAHRRGGVPARVQHQAHHAHHAHRPSPFKRS